MDNIKLSSVNQIHINKQTENKNVTSPINSSPNTIEDGENKMNKVLIGLGILGAAGIAVACAMRGRNPKNTPDSKDVQKLVKQFQDIDFNKGQAKLKDGTLFTGAIEKASENGDKLSMEYVNGVLQKSTKTTNGVEVIKEYTNGVISKKNGEVVDIKKVQNEVNSQQDRLKKLLADGEITSEEFKKQTDEIKFKSKKQETQIKETFDKKVQSEEAAKEGAEEKAKVETERLAKETDEKTKQAKIDTKKYERIQQNIQHSKQINAQVDEIMKQDDFDEKVEKLLKAKVQIQKGRYDCTLIETTIDDVLNGSILGEYTQPIDTLYHGTNQTSYQEIMKNGFSFDACNIGESGKGIYFGTKQSGGERYSTGGLIKAKYTGEKVANVQAGTLESLQYNMSVRQLFEDIFGHDFMSNDSDYLNTEILNRIYTKKLADMGYDAVYSASVGAGCDYIAILNPNKIQIID
ncbi:MAG: hypothetical protein IKU37_02825 [Candidatus Gastranaerophilales bacterium]|nr:hypothetical protein [Candidatus Gastranaerophilales bacterium]